MAPDVGNRCGAFVTPGKFDERDAHQRHGCGDVVRQDAPGRSTVAPAPLLDMGQRRPADLPWCAYPGRPIMCCDGERSADRRERL
jgi:hypothetical protein